MKVVVLVAVFAGLGLMALVIGVGLDGIDRFMQRRFPQRPFLLTGRRAWIAGIAATGAWAGVVLVGAWSLVRFPGSHELDTPAQPAPAALWQVGLALAGLGVLVTAIAVRSAPKVGPGGLSAQAEPSPRLAIGAMLLATDVPALAAYVVSPHSQLRGAPLLGAGVVTVFTVLMWQRDWYGLRGDQH